MQKLSIISKNYGNQVIHLDTFIPRYASVTSTVFKVIEHMFNEWLEYNTQPGAPLGKDIEGMYYGECGQPPIYSKKGAIRQGIENLIEEARERNLQVLNTAQIMKLDIECAFL